MSLAEDRKRLGLQERMRWKASCLLPLACYIGSAVVTLGIGFDRPAVAGRAVMQLSQASGGQELSHTNLLYVSPAAGNDAGGNGSERAPFKTITRALQVAESNTAIVLAPGTYSVQTGEQFPLILKSNVKLQGNPGSRGQDVIIQGGGQFVSPTSASQNIAILAATEGVSVSGVTVTNPNARGYGLWIESSSPTVTNNTFTRSTHDGISVVGRSRPVIRENYFTQNGANGITVFGSSQPEVRENIFENTGFGINVAQQAAPILIGNRITLNKDGVVVQAQARPVLRSNYIERNQRDGVVAIAQSLPDLGTSAEPGGNVIRNNGRYDVHNAVAGQIIPAYGNQLTSNRTSGRIDIAGVYRPSTPPPVATRPPLTPLPRPATPRPAPQPPRALPVPAPTPVPPPSSRPLPPPLPRNSGGTAIPDGAIDIPVPTPEFGAVLESQPRSPRESQGPAASDGLLPVPGPNIPIGNGGYVPTRAPDPFQSASGSPPAPPSRGSALGLRYRVLVDIRSDGEQQRVRSLAPGAFRTYANGRMMMQAGAFREREKADALLQLLTTNGLSATVEEMN